MSSLNVKYVKAAVMLCFDKKDAWAIEWVCKWPSSYAYTKHALLHNKPN